MLSREPSPDPHKRTLKMNFLTGDISATLSSMACADIKVCRSEVVSEFGPKPLWIGRIAGADAIDATRREG